MWDKFKNISEALLTYNERIQALENAAQNMTNMSRIPEGIVSFLESPVWSSGRNWAECVNNVNENFLNRFDFSVFQTNAEAILNIENNLKVLTENNFLSQIENLKNLDFSNMTRFLEYVIEFNNRGIFNQAYEMAQRYSVDEEECELEVEFSNQTEFEETFAEQLENPIGFQERIANWAEAKKKKYFVFVVLIIFIWSNFVQPYFQDKIGAPVTANIVSNVKDLPDKTGKVICQLKEDIEAIIVENTNYYYKVKFVDENGVEREGYVAKRNLKIVEEVTESAVSPEEK